MNTQNEYKLVYLYPANVYQGDSRMFRDFLVVNANTGKEAIKVGEKELIQKYDGAKIVDIKRL